MRAFTVEGIWAVYVENSGIRREPCKLLQMGHS